MKKKTEEYVIPLQNANLVLIKADRGYIMCGLLNIESAERLGQAACMVTGVKTAEDALKAQVKACTTAAKQVGIKEGMTGQQALEFLN
ncbi:MAG: DUF1805 domain-containing protein [Candidatus Altiarchaeota archaeon]